VGRLTIFAKGNLDLRDSLHSLKIGDTVTWNGVNEILRSRFPGTLVRLRHEVWTRSDALLEADGAVPTAIAKRDLPLSPYTIEAQFSSALFDADCDAVILSILPDLTTSLVRHRRDGYLFYPYNWATWPPAEIEWLRRDFRPVGLLEVETSMSYLERIVARLRGRSPAPILIYNVSSVVPGDSVHCYAGLDDVFSSRIRRFNLGLIELSRRTGISIVDVDTLLARAGADRLKLDPVHLNAEGCRLVAAEVVRVLEDLGCLTPAEARS